jgi:hypothetical protein
MTQKFKIKIRKTAQVEEEDYEIFKGKNDLPFFFRINNRNIFITQPYVDTTTMNLEIKRRKKLLLTETIQINKKDFFDFADFIKTIMVVEKI